VAGLGRKATVLADADDGLLRGHGEDDLVELEAEVVDGFADEVAIAVADVLELLGRDADVQGSSADVGEAGRLQPRLIALTVDLFFERAQNANPLVQHGGWHRNE
jgi:hypothetical protein